MSSRPSFQAPVSPFAVLPLRTGVLFPGTTLAFPVGRDRSIALLESLSTGSIVGVVTQREASVVDPNRADLHDVGTFARLIRLERGADRVYRVVLEGLARFQLGTLVEEQPFWRAEGTLVTETEGDDPKVRVLADSLRGRVDELTGGGPGKGSIRADLDPGLTADAVAAGLELTTERAVSVLETFSVSKRLELVATLLAEAKAMAEMRGKIEADVRRELNKNQREALLREQMKAIRKEIGDDKSEDELSTLKDKLDKANLPDEIRKTADRELRRLESSAGQGPEANVIRTYLDWIADLPWTKRAETNHDLEAVVKQLDADHFGLDDVKQRILEHMAVLKLAKSPRGSILCFAGPPGVGKTSLGQSIADATGRPFVRIALGGARDEAEIRGHRRTYVGALPGRIMNALRKAGVKNPVVLLDEVDKLGTGWGGSPEAALLEVLDPEQNRTFTDHYMELPFDLSEVLFIATVNNLENLSAPLRDRLEVIELSGYTQQEKTEIARRHLIPKQLRETGVTEAQWSITDGALAAIVRDYTREAGVRQLQRELTRLARALALRMARGDQSALVVDEESLSKWLGKSRFSSEVAERTSVPGVATGMAWTAVGGDILFIETSRMPGKGHLEITGQLGDVMKESARAALTYVRSNARALGIEPRFLEEQDLHIHVPAGGTPKDGPSAGVTMFTALTSLLTGRRVRPDTAMTGECTLRGRVMPVGGIKVKVLAAHRAGIRRVVLPLRNARDVEEIPADVRASMEFIFAEDMSQVIEAALEPATVQANQAPANHNAEVGVANVMPTAA